MEENNQTTPKTGGNMMMVVGGLIVLVLLGGGVYYYMKHASSNSMMQSESMQPTKAMMDKPTMVPSKPLSPNDAMPSGASSSGKVSEIVVKGQNFSFAPNVITVKKGDTVKINFQNTGGFHDFVIDEFNVKTKTINGGESDTVQFTADKTGTFAFYCSVGKHRAMGMEGKLIVE